MINATLENDIAKIVESQGCTLFDIEILRENDAEILRVTIHKKSGVTHDDCQKISEILSPMLDVYENDFNEAYFLEVSSPGLERNLSKARHFECFVGAKILVTLRDKTKILGTLESADSRGFVLDSTRYEYDEIKKAKSVFEWN